MGWKLEEEDLERGWLDGWVEMRRKADQQQIGQELSRVGVELDGSHRCWEWRFLKENESLRWCGRKEALGKAASGQPWKADKKSEGERGSG